MNDKDFNSHEDMILNDEEMIVVNGGNSAALTGGDWCGGGCNGNDGDCCGIFCAAKSAEFN